MVRGRNPNGRVIGRNLEISGGDMSLVYLAERRGRTKNRGKVALGEQSLGISEPKITVTPAGADKGTRGGKGTTLNGEKMAG